MIEKLEKHIIGENAPGMVSLMVAPTAEQQVDKINEIIDDLHELKALYKEYDKSFTAAIESINVHEKQIDELQAKVNKMAQNFNFAQPEVKENVDPYAEQRKWVGKVCWFWDSNAKTKAFGQLNQVDPLDDGQNAPYQTNYGQWYEHCEPVKPDDDIIYRGE